MRLRVGRREGSDPIGQVLARSWPSIVTGAAALGLVLWLAWEQGGYFPPSYLLAGTIAMAVLGAVLILRPPHYSVSTEALVGVAGLVGLAVWTAISAGWSPTPETAIEDMERTLAYVAIFGLGLFAAGSGRFSRQLVWLMLAAITVVVGAGLLSRLQPDLISGPAVTSEIVGYRLAYPLDYWNAFGALAAMGGLLAAGLAADPRQHPVGRAAAAGVAVPLFVAMYLSLSRGSWLGLAVGVVVLLVLSSNRWSLLLTGALVGGLVAISVLVLQGFPALVDDASAGAGQAAEGDDVTATLLGLILIAVAAEGVIATGSASQSLMVGMRRVVRPLLIAIAGVITLAALGVYLVKTDAVEEAGAEGLASVEGFVGEQWDEFMQPGAVEERGTERLTTASGTRSDLYRVAIDGFERHPLRGEGSGGFQPLFLQDREVDEEVRDAHSLYLETLGELGLVGLLLLLVFIGSLVVAALRARLRPAHMGRSQAAAVTAACAVWVAHAGVDWDWQVPALTSVFLILAASLYPEGRKPAQRLRRPYSEAVEKNGVQRRRGAAMR